MTEDEKLWVLWGMAWVGLRHWQCGRAEGDAARAWLWAEIDRRLRPEHPLLSDDLERLEAALQGGVHAGPGMGIDIREAFGFPQGVATSP